MLLRLKHAEYPWSAIWLIVLSILLRLAVDATPIRSLESPSSSIELGPRASYFDELAQHLQTHQKHLDKRQVYFAGEDLRSWVYSDVETQYAFGVYETDGTKGQWVQLGLIEFGKLLAIGYRGTVYNATLWIYDCGVVLDGTQSDISGGVGIPVVAKSTGDKSGYNGAKLIDYIDDSTHLPIVYVNTLLDETRSLVALEELDEDAYDLWGKYTVLPFDRLKMMLQVTEGVMAAHEKNIIHLDLKPANFMVKKDKKQPDNVDLWYWKDIDWDSAIDMNSVKVEDWPARVGSYAFRSPEMQEKKWKKWPKLQDPFGLGMTLLQLLRRTNIYQKAWERLIVKHHTQAETLSILREVYGLTQLLGHDKIFWNFLANVLCGPEFRISLEAFYEGLNRINYIPAFE